MSWIKKTKSSGEKNETLFYGLSSLVFVSFNSLGKCELSERFDQQNHAAHKTLFLLFVAEDRGDKDEEARESVDHREYDSLNIASAPGREEPDDKAQAESGAQDQAVPYGLHQLERQ